jgi:hypothetical protein
MASYTPIFDNDELEKRSLQQQKPKTTKKSNYGSLRVEQPQQTKQTSTAFIVNYKHKISPGETLLGISLKYGVPVSVFLLIYMAHFISKNNSNKKNNHVY